MGFKRFLSIHRFFLIALIFAMIISFWQFIEGVLLWDNPAYGIPENAYISWIGGTLFFSQSYWFYLVLPLLASISTGLEYGKLNNDKYFNQVRIRMTKLKFILTIGLRGFLLGFVVIVVPLFLNFVLTMTVKPILYPDPLVAIGPYACEIGAELYYSHPMIYTIGYILLDGIFGGICSLLTIVLCNVVENYFFATIIPFILYYSNSMISVLFNDEGFALNIVLTPGIGVKTSIGYLIILLVMFITIISWIILGYMKDK